jgi:hypothetical protein
MLAFLDSLTGTLPNDYIAKPELPAFADRNAIPVEAKPKDGEAGGDDKPKPKKPKDDEPKEG